MPRGKPLTTDAVNILLHMHQQKGLKADMISDLTNVPFSTVKRILLRSTRPGTGVPAKRGRKKKIPDEDGQVMMFP